MENNLSLYHIFLSVAENGNITKAADELFISQPAISKAIHKLEDNLGVKLFLRSTRGVRLTYEGRLLYDEISKAFYAIRNGEELLKQSSALGMGHLTIGVSTTLCKFVLLPYLRDFIKAFPNVRISIECQSTYETLPLLESGKIDIGLIGNPGDLKSGEFRPLRRIQDIFVASGTYLDLLQGQSGYESSAILTNATLMLLNKENITRRYVDDCLLAQNFHPQNMIEVTSMDLLIEFAKIGLGVSCVIRDFVENELAGRELYELKLPVTIPEREIGFIYRKNALVSPTLKNFLAFVYPGVQP